MAFNILTGSIGAREATVEANDTVETIAQLEQFFTAIGNSEAHRQWAGTLNPTWFQRSGTFIVLCEAVADALKVRNAGAMTWPPDRVTRKMASPR
jgi:hypothetical protein